VWQFKLAYSETPVKSEAKGFTHVRSLVSGFERIGYLDTNGVFREVSMPSGKTRRLKGFENIKSYSMSLADESTFDALIDQNDDLWLIPIEDGEPIRQTMVNDVKQVCAGRHTALIL